MDPQFEELAQRLKNELAPAIADQLKSELATVVADQLKIQLPTVVADQFAAAESRLVEEYKIHAEEMKSEVRRAAEGYGSTLEAINRKLQELETKWDTRIYDHERVLDNHNHRITLLEEKRQTKP